jgi:hypothetical protein
MNTDQENRRIWTVYHVHIYGTDWEMYRLTRKLSSPETVWSRGVCSAAMSVLQKSQGSAVIQSVA